MDVFLPLINNIALLVALSVLYGLVMRRCRPGAWSYPVLSGLLFGGVTLIGMMTPLKLAPGLIFDGRSIILSVAGLFGGPVVAGIAAVTAGIYCWSLGGTGMVMGISVIAESAMLGVAFYYWRRRHEWIMGVPWLLAFGLLVHVGMLALIFAALPADVAAKTFHQLAVPVLLLYPVAQLLVCLLFLDLEARFRAETALRESEERFRSYVENAPDAILVATASGRVVDCNLAACAMLGYSRAELLRKEVWDLSPAGWVEKAKAAYDELGQMGRYQFEKVCRRQDGHEIWVEVAAARLGPDRFIAFYKDITERRALEDQLMQARKMESVGRLAGGVAHDFNNMLQAILGHAALALDQVPAASPVRENLEEIQHAAQRSADLTRQLLTFARNQLIRPRVLALNEVIPDILKMLKRLIGENLQLSWVPAAGLWDIQMDPTQIDQILTNLTVNARDAIAGSGTITIATENVTVTDADDARCEGCFPGDYVLLTVGDTGCGMDAETQAHLFEPFFTSKGLGKGTGLGLATVYGIVKQNHGGIVVRSEPGRGTTFRIYLLRSVSGNGGGAEETASPAAVKSTSGTETILVVEDEAAILDITRRFLIRQGYQVLTANSPTEALALAKSHPGPIDVLVTDVVMPGMNGRELWEHLRQLRPTTRCLFMSGYATHVIAPLGVLETGGHIIHKPFTANMLTDKVRQLLDQGRAPAGNGAIPPVPCIPPSAGDG